MASSQTSDGHRANNTNTRSPQGSIYKEIPLGVWMCDADGGLRYANHHFLDLLGISMEEASGFGWTDCIAAEDMDSVDRWKQCIKQGQDFDDEHRIQDQQGRTRTLLARGHAVRDNSGEVEHWIGVHLDITERKRAEQQVEDARHFAEVIIETVPEPIIVLDREHRVVTANPAFYRQFAVERNGTQGKTFHELGDGQWDIPALRNLLEQGLNGSKPFDGYEVEHDFPHIGRKMMLVSGRRIERQGNHTEMILLVIRDITESRQQEDRLRIVQETQAVQRERQRLSHRLHDHVQQLLHAASLQIAVVQRNEPREENKELLRKVQRALQEAGAASRDLAVELTPPVLFESGLAAALQWLAEWVKDKYELQVELEVEQGIELEDEHICQLLFDTVRELLLNVSKHADVDAAKVRAERTGDDLLQIVVMDEGTGFQPDQIHKKEDLAAGFGLGTIKRRVESIGGSLDIESTKGGGTKVTVRAPLRTER